jgi:hypothetical protein
MKYRWLSSGNKRLQDSNRDVALDLRNDPDVDLQIKLDMDLQIPLDIIVVGERCALPE